MVSRSTRIHQFQNEVLINLDKHEEYSRITSNSGESETPFLNKNI
jgi:hypothetical protein